MALPPRRYQYRAAPGPCPGQQDQIASEPDLRRRDALQAIREQLLPSQIYQLIHASTDSITWDVRPLVEPAWPSAPQTTALPTPTSMPPYGEAANTEWGPPRGPWLSPSPTPWLDALQSGLPAKSQPPDPPAKSAPPVLGPPPLAKAKTQPPPGPQPKAAVQPKTPTPLPFSPPLQTQPNGQPWPKQGEVPWDQSVTGLRHEHWSTVIPLVAADRAEKWREQEDWARLRHPGLSEQCPLDTEPISMWPLVSEKRLLRKPEYAGCVACQVKRPLCQHRRCLRACVPFCKQHRSQQCTECHRRILAEGATPEAEL